MNQRGHHRDDDDGDDYNDDLYKLLSCPAATLTKTNEVFVRVMLHCNCRVI